jgi:hypothetical protein
MTKAGTGLAAIQERIRKSFLEVHHDQRTREERQADEEMIACIAPRKSGTEAVRDRIQEAFQQARAERQGIDEQQRENKAVAPIDENATNVPKSTSEKRVSAYVSAALRSPHIAKHLPLRSDVHRCYAVEEPRESADTLFAQALRHLESK